MYGYFFCFIQIFKSSMSYAMRFITVVQITLKTCKTLRKIYIFYSAKQLYVFQLTTVCGVIILSTFGAHQRATCEFTLKHFSFHRKNSFSTFTYHFSFYQLEKLGKFYFYIQCFHLTACNIARVRSFIHNQTINCGTI